METDQGQDRKLPTYAFMHTIGKPKGGKKIKFLYMTVTQKNMICMYTICKPRNIIIIRILNF
jgi:hypothetical protein